jgi:DNA adenine methylase
VRVPRRRPASPFFKCAGGKTGLLPELLVRVPEKIGTYHERFAGGAALFFALAPERAMLADANPDLVAALRATRDSPSALVEVLCDMPRTREHYLAVRAAEPGTSDVARGARFLYLTACGFNGLWRVSRRTGQHNVPFAGSGAHPATDDHVSRLWDAHVALRGVSVDCADFALDRGGRTYEPGDFVYFDPPYAPTSPTASFVGYGSAGFGDADQVRLRDHALALKRRGVRVLLSNSDVPLTRDLYTAPDFLVERVFALRRINSKGDRRGAVPELLIS